MADKITASLSLAHQRKNKQTDKQKLSTNLTLYEAYTNHWTNLRKAETTTKKESNFEAWEGDLKQNKLKKNSQKAEKYHTNEGTN